MTELMSRIRGKYNPQVSINVRPKWLRLGQDSLDSRHNMIDLDVLNFDVMLSDLIATRRPRYISIALIHTKELISIQRYT